MKTHDPTKITPNAWRPRFDALIRARMAAPFVWGTNDCCMFAADAVQTITGTDLAADLRGTYTTAQQATTVLQRIGGLEAAGARAGAEIGPLFAQIGDVGIASDGEQDVLAVCAGSVWLVPVAAGLAALPLAAGKKAWRAVACHN